MAKATRLLFVADLHGSAICFRKFINAAKVYNAQVLLVGGDIASKTVTPVFEGPPEWTATVEGESRRARSKEELAALEDWLRNSATVPLQTTRSEWAELIANRPKADAVFERQSLRELEHWLSWAKERLRGGTTRLLLGLGNDDFTSMEDVIARDDVAELTDNTVVRLDEHHEILTLQYSNRTPWATPRELTEEAIATKLDEGQRQLEHPDRAIFNLHVPPHGTNLDLAPRLTHDLTKVMAPGGDPDLVHVGSTAVRAAIDRYQPLLGLHGHIHESRGYARLGRSICLNPGSAYGEGTLLGVVVDLVADGIRSHLLTTG
ncbi:MAG: metallophosphoesterase [Thermoplasmata archaeon]